MSDFCGQLGIIQEFTVPRNPQMNGAAERLGDILHLKAAILLKDSDLPDSCQAQLFLTANYLRNRSPVSGHDVTPYENVTGAPPKLGHL